MRTFKSITGIDLSSNTFNSTINNDQADVSPPSVRDFSVEGDFLFNPVGSRSLDITSGDNATVSITGSVVDEIAGFDNLWVEFRERESGNTVSQSVDAYQLEPSGKFAMEFDFSYQRSGEWFLGGLQLSDRANNEVFYWDDSSDSNLTDWQEVQLQKLGDLGLNINNFSFSVFNDNDDRKIPSFDNVSLDFDQQSSVLSFTGNVSDDKSGFDFLWLRFENSTTLMNFGLMSAIEH